MNDVVVDHPEPFIVILDGVIDDCLPRVGNALIVFGQNNDGGVTGYPIRFVILGLDEDGIRSRLFLHIDVHNDVRIDIRRMGFVEEFRCREIGTALAWNIDREHYQRALSTVI